MKSLKNSSLFFCLLFFINSLIYGQQALDSVKYYRELIVKPKQSDDLISGYIFFRNHKDESLLKKDTLAAVYDLQLKLIAEIEFGALYDAETSIVEALNLLDHLNQDNPSIILDYRSRLYNELGIVYRGLKNYDKALEVFDKSIAMGNPQIDSLSLINNKGNVFKDKGDFLKAEKEYTIVYKERLKGSNLKKTANALNNLGAIQGKLNKPDGIEKMKEALAIRIAENDLSGTFSSYSHLTEFYRDRNEIAKAKEYALLGYKTANSYSKKYKMQALSNLMELSEDSYALEFSNMTDSISNAKSIQENKFAIAKYDLEKEQKKTLESELKREKERRQKFIYQAIGALILITAIFFYFIIRVRHKKSEIEQIYKTETRISRKIHDEVANGVYHAMSMLENNTNAKEEVIDSLELIYSKTRDISKETSAIEVSENFNELLNDLLLSYKNEEVNIITKNISKIDWALITDNKKTALYRVLQELMTNMRKHSKATLVALTFNYTKSKLVVDYKDNGIGCDLKKNDGLLNTENRIEIIKGTISFESKKNQGFKATITI